MSDNYNYLIGETGRISVSIADGGNVAGDPGALRLKVKTPIGTVTAYVFGASGEIVKDSVGHYHADILLDTIGTWAWRWESDAPNAGASEGVLVVKKSVVI
ncbi:MAG: hypothetical protein PHD37_17765 [Gallionellaceae bacterium]|nr:hypothetical protein [Gallionellaceae bacterium]